MPGHDPAHPEGKAAPVSLSCAGLRRVRLRNHDNVAHPLTGALSAAVEYWRQDNHDPSGRVKQESADIAFTYLASPDLQLDVGANIGANRATPDHQLYAGASYRW